jgi:hypothetical protein
VCALSHSQFMCLAAAAPVSHCFSAEKFSRRALYPLSGRLARAQTRARDARVLSSPGRDTRSGDSARRVLLEGPRARGPPPRGVTVSGETMAANENTTPRARPVNSISPLVGRSPGERVLERFSALRRSIGGAVAQTVRASPFPIGGLRSRPSPRATSELLKPTSR